MRKTCSKIGVYLVMVVCIGCGDVDPLETISGIVVDVQICNEREGYTTLLVKFEDGRLRKARCFHTNPIMFHLGKKNMIIMDSKGLINGVQIIDEKGENDVC